MIFVVCTYSVDNHELVAVHGSYTPIICGTIYGIHGTSGDDSSLAVWQFWLRLPKLMYTKTTYNHMYYETL